MAVNDDCFAEDRRILRRLRDGGWSPECVYDVGASNGAWTWMARELFPLAEFHLFEPLLPLRPDYREGVEGLRALRDLRLAVHAVALDSTRALTRFGQSRDGVGSSLLAQQVSEWFPEVVELQTVPMDDYRAEHGLAAPQLIKMDVQGAELRILQGAERTLEAVEILVLETWLVRGYGPATPLLHELIQWLEVRGFSVIDFGGEYRQEGRLVAKDVVFARSFVGVAGDEGGVRPHCESQ